MGVKWTAQPLVLVGHSFVKAVDGEENGRAGDSFTFWSLQCQNLLKRQITGGCVASCLFLVLS